MGDIVFAAAASHAPGLIGMLDQAPEQAQQMVHEAYGRLADDLRAAEVDVLIIVGNDHLANNRLREYPDFLLGLAPEHRGPFEWFRSWLGCEEYVVPGDVEFAETVFNGLIHEGVRVSGRRANLRFDDNVSIPVIRTGIVESGVKLMPLLQNCTVPPVPDQRESYRVGRALGKVIRERVPDGVRVGLLGSGGLSHEPGGVRDFWVDEQFDQWFLDLLARGDHEEILDKVTLEVMDRAGIGGTSELLSWIVVMGAIGERPCEVLGYTAWDQWRCGIGAVTWDVAALTPAASGH